MSIRKLLTGVAALGLVTSPVIAQAAPAAAARTSAGVGEGEDLAGGLTPLIIAGVIAAVVAVVIIADNDDDDEEPASP